MKAAWWALILAGVFFYGLVGGALVANGWYRDTVVEMNCLRRAAEYPDGVLSVKLALVVCESAVRP